MGKPRTANKADNTSMRDQVYYTIQMWVDRTKLGGTLTTIYWRKANALRRMNQLIDSGLYEMVVIRKEEVWYREPNTTEISASTVEEKWEKEVA